jgi:carbonic anhydrase
VAGNIVAPSQIGSVEFAAAQFNTKLVVVLGHSDCGAIKATLDELDHSAEDRSPNLRSIVDRIRPAVQSLIEAAHADNSLKVNSEDFLDNAVRANIVASVSQLRHGSSIIEELTEKHGLKIVGAEYSVRTGIVEFL